MDSGLGGTVAMVSGASKGIGRAIAEKPAAEDVRQLGGIDILINADMEDRA